MRLTMAVWFLVLLPVAAAHAAPAETPAVEPPAKHCYGDSETKWIFGESFAGLTNALGFENQARVARCWPLIKKRGLLYDYTNIEVGLVHYLSLPYSQQGGFVSIAPLSILSFKLEVTGYYIWPITALDGASHYPRTGYDDRFDSDGVSHGLDTDTATSAGGMSVTFTTNLMASVELSRWKTGPLELLIINSFAVEYWLLGKAPYYYNVKKDVILARSDLLMTNTALVLLSIPLSGNRSFRLGAMDMLAYLPRDKSLGYHQLGGLFALNFDTVGRRVRALQPFLYISAYTHHAHRRLSFPLNLLAGVELVVVLSPTPRSR